MRAILTLLFVFGAVGYGGFRIYNLFSGKKFEPEVSQVEETEKIELFNQYDPRLNNFDPVSNPEIDKLEIMLLDLERQKEEEKRAREAKAIELSEKSKKKDEASFIVHRFEQRSVPGVEDFQKLFEEKALVDLHTNSVIVSVDTPARGVAISNVLTFLDVPSGKRLYRVEGVVVNASLTDSDDFSIDWLAKYQSPGVAFPLTQAASGPGLVSLQSQYLDLAIQKAKVSGALSVLARPSLVLAPGEIASISSGREVPIPVANTQDGNVTSSVDYLSVALSLEVTLEEIGNQQISLSIKQVNASVTGETIIDDNVIPEVSSQEWQTQIQPEFGRWYAIGGVNSQSESDANQKGWIFKNRKSKSSDRREVGMFIRVVNVTSSDPPRDVYEVHEKARPLLRAVPVVSK